MNLIDSITHECESCAKGKMKKQISRKIFEKTIIEKFQKFHVDWIDFSRVLAGYVRIMFVTNDFIGLMMPYFMISAANETKNLKILKDLHAWIIKKHLNVQIIRSNEKFVRNKIFKWMKANDIDFEFSASRTQAQNEVAERSKSVIVRQIKIMTIDAKLPGDLWKKMIDAVAYLHNRTFKQSLGWKFPFEMFHDRKSRLTHLKIYECRIYTTTENVQKKSFAKTRISNVFRLINVLSIKSTFFAYEFSKKV